MRDGSESPACSLVLSVHEQERALPKPHMRHLTCTCNAKSLTDWTAGHPGVWLCGMEHPSRGGRPPQGKPGSATSWLGNGV